MRAQVSACSGISEFEMNRTFNNGIGMVLVLAPEHAEDCARTLRELGETVCRIGQIAAIGTGAAVEVR